MTVYDYDGTSSERDNDIAHAVLFSEKGTLRAAFPCIFEPLQPLWRSSNQDSYERRCTICHKWKVTSEFRPHTGYPLGVEYRCWDCEEAINPPVPRALTVIWKREETA